jgi:hypothetical protein
MNPERAPAPRKAATIKMFQRNDLITLVPRKEYPEDERSEVRFLRFARYRTNVPEEGTVRDMTFAWVEPLDGGKKFLVTLDRLPGADPGQVDLLMVKPSGMIQ